MKRAGKRERKQSATLTKSQHWLTETLKHAATEAFSQGRTLPNIKT